MTFDLRTPVTLEMIPTVSAALGVPDSAPPGDYRTLIFGEVCPVDPDGVCEDVTIEARFTVE